MARKKRYIQVESKNALLELLLAGEEFEKIYVASNAFRDSKTKQILQEAGGRGIPVKRVSRRRLNRISRTSSCESVIGLKPSGDEVKLSDILESGKKKDGNWFFVILNNVRYAQNIGALLRTAYACGVDAVILPKKRDKVFTDEVTRISMGASERVPVINTNMFSAIKELKDFGIKIAGVHMKGQDYFNSDLKGDLALVLGGEHEGVSKRILDRCDTLVKIPMQEGIDSLNVSAAGAIVMFEKKRQDE